MRITLLSFLIFSYSLSVFSQKDKDKTLFVGVTLGTKIANKHYADRYSGIYSFNGTNQTQLEGTLINNIQNYEAIRQLLGGYDFQIPYPGGYSSNITYTPGLLTGVTLGYQISPNLQVSIDGNINRLKVKNVFSLEVFDGSIQTSQEQYELGQIYAEESRFDGRFNFDYKSEGNKVDYIIGLSGLFSAWRIDKHSAIFRSYEMQIFSQFNPDPNSALNINRGSGIGFGINLGVEYRINEKIVSQIMYQPYQSFMDYGIPINKRFLPQHDLIVRLLWK
jgi:hypothetical protein